MPHKDPETNRTYQRDWARRARAADPEKQKAAARAYRQKNLAKKREYERAYEAAHKDQRQAQPSREPRRLSAVKRKWAVRNKDKWKAYRVKYAYGLTADDHARLKVEQDGRCAICHAIPSQRQYVVDHCHDTQTVRGLLCGKCNSALGMFDDDPERMERAAEYIRAFRARMKRPA